MPEPDPTVRTTERALVPVPRLAEEPMPLADPRRSDIDEWGRSERVRQIARRIYEPLYRNWFRVEWEGMEHIPAEGGALLVANHAGAIPSDAPAIMHGIETELGRPVYGMAEHLFRQLPVVSTWWARSGGVSANPHNAYRLLREQQQLALGPLGLVTYFPAKFKIRVLEPVHFDAAPDQPRYSRSKVMDHSEDIRERIQEALYDMLRKRRSVWFG